MKKTILTFLIVLAFFSSIAQSFPLEEGTYLTDSIIYWRKVIGFPESTREKEVMKYNEFNTVYLHQLYTNIYEGDDGGIDWKAVEKSNYFYDNQGTLLNIIREKRAVDAEEWTNDLKTIYTFSGNDSIVTYQEWKEGAWQEGARWTYTYTPENYESIALWQSWNPNSNVWDNINRFDTIYTADGLFDTLKYFIWFSQDEMDTGFIKTFDYTFYPDTIISDYYTADKHERSKQYHDSTLNADVAYTLRYVDSSDSFRPLSKRFLYMDNARNVIRDDLFLWLVNQNAWDLSTRIDYHFNVLDLLFETLYYVPGDSLTVFEKRTFSYNAAYLLSKQMSYLFPIDDDVYEKWRYYYSLKYVGVLKDPGTRAVKAYPNPAHDQLFIDNSALIYRQYQIYDLSGRLVKSDRLIQAAEVIDISRLPAGNYILNLVGRHKTFSQQLIKLP